MQNQTYSLEVKNRTLTRKKTGKLRRQDILPAVIFGKAMESISIEMDYRSFENIYRKVHGTHLIDLNLENEPIKVLVHSIQRSPSTYKIIHVDFHKIDMNEKVNVEIPIILSGKSPIEDLGGKISQQITALLVKCLPTDIPESITLDLTKLVDADNPIHVKDLALPAGVILAHEPDAEKIAVSVMTIKAETAKAVEEEAPAAE